MPDFMSPVRCISNTATTRNMNPSATCRRPRYILTGVFGFLPRSPSLLHSIENSGASSTMKSGLSDWNQPVGTVKLPTERSVYRSANRFRRPPACSKAAQNITTKMKITKITRSRSRSICVSGCFFPPAIASERLAAGSRPMSPM